VSLLAHAFARLTCLLTCVFAMSVQSFRHSAADDPLGLGVDLNSYVDQVHRDRSGRREASGRVKGFGGGR